MFTILLYYDNENKIIEERKFLFEYVQLKQHLVMLSVDEEKFKNIDALVNDIIMNAAPYGEWKLVLFDSRTKDKGNEDMNPEIIREEWYPFLAKLYEPNADRQFQYPTELWYVNCYDRSKWKRDSKEPAYSRINVKEKENEKDSKNEIFNISNYSFSNFHLKMCCIGLDYTLNDMGFEKFRVCCILQTLVSNEIPSNYMHPEWLYEIDVHIHERDFLEYISYVKTMIDKIDETLQIERENFRQEKRRKIPYKKPQKENVFLELSDEATNENGWQKIDVSDLKNRLNDKLYALIYKNRTWLLNSIHYPKGDLHDVLKRAKKIDSIYDKAALDDAGMEHLETALNSHIVEIDTKTKQKLNPKQIKARYREKEKEILNTAEEKSNGYESNLIRLFLAFAAVGLIYPIALVNASAIGQFAERCKQGINNLQNLILIYPDAIISSCTLLFILVYLAVYYAGNRLFPKKHSLNYRVLIYSIGVVFLSALFSGFVAAVSGSQLIICALVVIIPAIVWALLIMFDDIAFFENYSVKSRVDFDWLFHELKNALMFTVILELFGIVFSFTPILSFLSYLGNVIFANYYVTGYIALFVLIYLLILEAEWFADWIKCERYNSFMKKEVFNIGKDKNKLTQEIMQAMASYQSNWIIKEYQKVFSIRNEEVKNCLIRHGIMLEKMKNSYHKLKKLLGEETPLIVFELPDFEIDYNINPEEIGYYWLQVNEMDIKCEVNHSGVFLEYGLPFIDELSIVSNQKFCKNEGD